VAGAFRTEPPPPWGVALEVVPGIRRVVAPNPGKMTYHGTNTYLLDDEGGTIVVDPGPDDAGHVAAVLAASGRVSRIVITHTHHDHVGAAPALRAACGAPAPTGWC
jgi:glyoxylase-like metal-dependent hydrolase (beta-lactamase superfamily II)